jgi:predicted ArsR family transcriptional regulator
MSTRQRILDALDELGEASGAEIWSKLRWHDLRMYAHLWDMEMEGLIRSRCMIVYNGKPIKTRYVYRRT